MTQDTRPAFLTVPEAAAQLGVSRSQCYRLLDSGQLPSIVLGKSRRIPAAAIERLVEQAMAGQR